MPTKRDAAQTGYDIVQELIRRTETIKPVETAKPKPKNAAAVALGRLGGLKGGPARAAALTKAQRQEIGRKAAAKRWDAKG